MTPLQALTLLNHSFSLRMAEHFADRLNDSSDAAAKHRTVEDQIRDAFQRIYGRFPDATELNLSRNFIAKQGVAAFCRALWNSSEFLFVD